MGEGDGDGEVILLTWFPIFVVDFLSESVEQIHEARRIMLKNVGFV